MNKHMHEHLLLLLLSLTSGAQAAKSKHGKTPRGDRTITRTHYLLVVLTQKCMSITDDVANLELLHHTHSVNVWMVVDDGEFCTHNIGLKPLLSD